MQTTAFSEYSSSILSVLTRGLRTGARRIVPEREGVAIRVTRVSDDEFEFDRVYGGSRVAQELRLRRRGRTFEPVEFCGQDSSDARLDAWSRAFVDELTITCNLATIH